MVMSLTDGQINDLLKERKPLPKDFRNRLSAKPKSSRKHIEAELTVRGVDDHKFILSIRRNTENITGFSVILQYVEERTNKHYLLIRCNGRHEHTNQIENEKINGFHIHMATERYLDLGNNNPGYAVLTDEYTSYSGALDTMIRRYGFQIGEIAPLEYYLEAGE
jgi:hypothetical protein